jgi:hypothetical protein
MRKRNLVPGPLHRLHQTFRPQSEGPCVVAGEQATWVEDDPPCRHVGLEEKYAQDAEAPELGVVPITMDSRGPRCIATAA